jgi:hypothetical protein
MGENEEKPQTIPSLDDVGEGMTDEQRERQSRQPGAGSAGEAAPEGDPPSPKEPAEIDDQDQVKGQTASPEEPLA